MQLQYFKLDLDNRTMRQFYNYRRDERIILVANKYPLLSFNHKVNWQGQHDGINRSKLISE